MIDDQIHGYLIDYVVNQHLEEGAEDAIYEFCSKQDSITTIVYRGHAEESNTIKPNMWYSSSKYMKVAAEQFSGTNCCIFKIHLINVPCIDINSFVGDKISDHNEEDEIIFLGTGKYGEGTFYKNEDLSEEGFLELGNDNKYNKYMYECWYSIKPHEKNNSLPIDLDEIANTIDKDEYELIDGPDDLFFPDIQLTPQQKQYVYDIIKKRKEIGGGRRKNRKRTKRNRGKKMKGKNKRNTRKRVSIRK